MEGFLTALCLICTVLGITETISTTPIKHHSTLDYCITFAVPVLLLSAGTGLLVLDQCLSRRLSLDSHEWQGYGQSLLHIVFRCVEVWSRAIIFAIFIVIQRKDFDYMLHVLLVFDVLVALTLIAVHGGAETSWSVRLVCAIPCIFADIFFFIDSPYKRMAARKLSSCLFWRNVLEVLVMMVITPVLVQSDSVATHLRGMWHTNEITLSLGIIALILYPIMYFWAWTVRRSQRLDIFTACVQGNARAVAALTTNAAVGFSLDCRDVFGKTPLMLAAAHGHAEICRTLTKEGATVDAFTLPVTGCLSRPYSNIFLARSKWTAMHFAASGGHEHVLRVLLEDAAKSGTKGTKESEEAALTSSRTGRTFRDARKCTPLHIAAWRGHQECVQLLKRFCPNMVPARDEGGKTPEQRSSKSLSGDIFQHTDSLLNPEISAAMMSLDRSEAPLPTSGDVETGGGVADTHWPRVQIPIGRTNDTRQDASGLCSFVAGSSGGVMASLFLLDARQQHGLEVIIEDQPFQESPLSQVEEEERPKVNYTSLDDVTADDANKPELLKIEDLEPIDRRGNAFEVRRQSHSGSLGSRPGDVARELAHRMTRPPNAAILGEGSFGIVWRARDKQTDKLYAVKIISARQRRRAGIAMRDAEAAELVRCHPHPCLVTLHLVHHFVDAQSYMLVMEFCENGDLGDKVCAALVASNPTTVEGDRVRPNYTPPVLSLTWIGQSYLGLEHLHLNAGALLRDLKVENVVIDRHNCAKIIDFGLVRMSTESDGTWTFGVPPGSPGYIAPEIVRGETYSFPADLYSFGVLVWVLLSGGVNNHTEPTPPISTPGFGYQSHADDWRLLQKALDRPERHHARPLPNSAAKDFVSKLTQQRKERRMGHAQIRNHSFFKPLRLPPSSARKSEVEAWVAKSMLDGAAQRR